MLPPDLLALAYELRVAGCRWKWIAIGLGVDPEALYSAVRHTKRHGLHDSRVRLTDRQLSDAQAMRRHSRLSWRAIARYLGAEPHALQCAIYRRKTRPKPGQS